MALHVDPTCSMLSFRFLREQADSFEGGTLFASAMVAVLDTNFRTIGVLTRLTLWKLESAVAEITGTPTLTTYTTFRFQVLMAARAFAISDASVGVTTYGTHGWRCLCDSC